MYNINCENELLDVKDSWPLTDQGIQNNAYNLLAHNISLLSLAFTTSTSFYLLLASTMNLKKRLENRTMLNSCEFQFSSEKHFALKSGMLEFDTQVILSYIAMLQRRGGNHSGYTSCMCIVYG